MLKEYGGGGGLAERGFCLENLGVVGERRRAFF